MSRLRPARKRRDRYHHGDLRRALVDQALRTIADDGVAALTLRGVGAALGVSRTALYRHFADKEALLAAVATEGFRALRAQLAGAWDDAGRGRAGFEAMGVAYVRFALANPAQYRVMFGSFLERRDQHAELDAAGTAAFQVLLDSLVERQRAGAFRPGDPQQLGRYVWAMVHGIAMLGIDRRLGSPQSVEALVQMAVARIQSGLARRP